MKIKTLITATLVAAFLTAIASIGQAQVIAIKAGKLVDPELSTVAANQVILVEGRTIKSVGSNLKIPENATVIDLSKQTVLPGLFDAHAHLCMTTRRNRDGGRYYFTTLIDYKIGVILVHGPDVIFTTKDYSRGRLSIDTIDHWVEAGIPARVILQALTTNAARILGVEKERGAIRLGMKADLIATSNNPLDNIETLKTVTFVMKDGQVFKSSASLP